MQSWRNRREVVTIPEAFVLASSMHAQKRYRHALQPGQTGGSTLCGIAEPPGRWQLHGFARTSLTRIDCERCLEVASATTTFPARGRAASAVLPPTQ